MSIKSFAKFGALFLVGSLLIATIILNQYTRNAGKAIIQSSALRQHRRLLQLDPKTVQTKPMDESARFLVLSSRNGYSYYMGSSKPRPAYPTMLSSTSLNLIEIRDLTADYPALCLNTLVGGRVDHIFDVILIEYSHTLDASPAAIGALSARLRHRFPASLIVFVRIWYPIQITYKPKEWPLRRWMAENRISNLDGGAVEKKLLATGVTDWVFHEDPEVLAQLDQIVQSVNGHVWELPKPANVPEWLLEFGGLFTDDFLRLGPYGHEYVAQGIRSFVNEIPREQPILKQWLQPDQCASWYGGSINPGVPYKNMGVKKFDLAHNKWALECSNDKNDCKITVKSELNVMATVYLQYMAAGPRPVYQNYEVSIGNQPVALIQANLLNSPYAVHVQQMTAVGVIFPGDENTIFIRHKKGGKGKKHLRVTGVVISPVKIGHNYEESSESLMSRNSVSNLHEQ